MQYIELRDGPSQERKIEDREVDPHARHVGAAEDHFVDERRQSRFRDDRRVEEQLESRAGLAWLLGVHGELGYSVSIGPLDAARDRGTARLAAIWSSRADWAIWG